MGDFEELLLGVWVGIRSQGLVSHGICGSIVDTRGIMYIA